MSPLKSSPPWAPCQWMYAIPTQPGVMGNAVVQAGQLCVKFKLATASKEFGDTVTYFFTLRTGADMNSVALGLLIQVMTNVTSNITCFIEMYRTFVALSDLNRRRTKDHSVHLQYNQKCSIPQTPRGPKVHCMSIGCT